MRSFVIVLFSLLAACNESSNTVTPDPSLTQIQALQTQVDNLSAQVKQLQLIGRPVGQVAKTDQVAQFRMLGEPTLAPAASTGPAPVTGQFGPCADMGVLQGRGGSDTSNPLLSQFEIYKNCVNETYSISTTTGLLDIPPYLAWDGPNCTGNSYLEMDVPQNTMNQDAIKSGLVVQSPLPNDSSVFEINSTKNPPKTIMIQSALNTRPGSAGCQTDQEMRLVVLLIPNATQSTGAPNSMIPGTWTTTAP